MFLIDMAQYIETTTGFKVFAIEAPMKTDKPPYIIINELDGDAREIGSDLETPCLEITVLDNNYQLGYNIIKSIEDSLLSINFKECHINGTEYCYSQANGTIQYVGKTDDKTNLYELVHEIKITRRA